MDLPFVDLGLVLQNLGLIAVSFALALPVGWERERSAGLRTFPLVAIASEGAVRGTATAASVWNTGAIGAAVAFGRYEIAIVLALINFAALRCAGRHLTAGR